MIDWLAPFMEPTPAHELISHFARASCSGDLLAAHPNVYGLLAIGYDHTDSACNGQVIGAAKANQLLDADVIKVTDAIVRPLLTPKVRNELNANQLNAIVSFAHSIGRKVFNDSTVLARLNCRRYLDVPAELMKHNHLNGKPKLILVRRRLSEANLFCSFPGWLVPP